MANKIRLRPYPIIERSYFETEDLALGFARFLLKTGMQHIIITDYGIDKNRTYKPYYIETTELDPDSDKDQIVQKLVIA